MAGGTSDDEVMALAVTVDEIYVGGYVVNSAGMEGIGVFAGTAQVTEGFMMEISDAAAVSTGDAFWGLDF